MAKKRKDQLDKLKTSAQKVWLAGLGTLSEAEKQGDKLFKTLVKKGKKYEDVFREPVEMAGDAVDKAKKQANKAFKGVETVFDAQVDAAMRRLGIASSSEVEALRNEVARLKCTKSNKASDSRSCNNMTNPWLALPSSPPYVLPDDRTCVEAFNAKFTSDSPFRIKIEDVIPEPFVGTVKTAPVVVLQLNPGFSLQDTASHADPEFRTALISNLSHEPSQWPFYFFDPRFRDTHPGGRWWIKRTRRLAEVIPLPILAQRLAAVELFPYKSTKYRRGCRVRSQDYGFSLVASAMEREALVVIARGVRSWEGSVPALQYYPRKLTLSAKQNVFLTRNNVLLNGEKTPAAWDLLVNALL